MERVDEDMARLAASGVKRRNEQIISSSEYAVETSRRALEWQSEAATWKCENVMLMDENRSLRDDISALKVDNAKLKCYIKRHEEVLREADNRYILCDQKRDGNAVYTVDFHSAQQPLCESSGTGAIAPASRSKRMSSEPMDIDVKDDAASLQGDVQFEVQPRRSSPMTETHPSRSRSSAKRNRDDNESPKRRRPKRLKLDERLFSSTALQSERHGTVWGAGSKPSVELANNAVSALGRDRTTTSMCSLTDRG